MSFEILNRWTRAVVYASATAEDLSQAALEALKARANLADANLTGANLADADLTGADLTGANLADANLTDANLTGANLTDADLTGANLADANLTDANLTRADLTGADLTRADLTRANLTPVRDDFWAVLCAAPKEAFGLRLALIEGRINGSAYEGACACLVGTLANVRGCHFDAIPGLTPNGGRPAERFFLSIQPGDTPEKSQHAKLAVEWIDDWDARMRSAFTPEGTANAPSEAQSGE